MYHVSQWAKANACSDRVLALYVHHGISENADVWAEHCRKSAQDLGVRFAVEYVHLQGDGSLEQEARHARYDVFARYMRQSFAGNARPLLLTAHHQDDQVETFLLALKRGSGPTGLSAMAKRAPFASGVLLRPMSDIPRVYIESAAKELALSWVEDESNRDTQYDRNFFRHAVIPNLKNRFPGWNKAVCRSAELCAEQNALLDELLAERLQEAMSEKEDLPFYLREGLSLDFLTGESRSLQAALVRAWLKHLNAKQSGGVNRSFPMPSRAQLNAVLDYVVTAKGDANPEVSWEAVSVRRFKSRLYLISQYPDMTGEIFPVILNKTLTLPHNMGSFLLSYNDWGKNTLALRCPFHDEKATIRFGGSGLAPHPVGRQGKRKIKKLYQEYEVPSWMRTRLPLLFYNDELVAIAGLFVVEGFQAMENEAVYLHYC